ncbi:MAG TPA: cupredoxin domain-containing protein [Actinomycetota bacterium]|nr:cupredoxin domain-containing protein [Actinomycetota bacterium]
MATPEGVTPAAGTTWVKLLRWATIVSIVHVAVITIVVEPIPPLLVFAAIWIGGLVWLGRATKGPAILLLVSFVAFLGLSAPFSIPSLVVPASGGDFIVNLAGILAALVGIVAAVAVIRGLLDTAPAARSLATVAGAVFVLASAYSVYATATYDNAAAQEGDVELVAKDVKFEQTSLQASGGEISVFVDNEDPTFHTFTIEELDVDLDIPASKSARITFEAEPGEYEFFCEPHKEDMKGTLTVD